MLCQFIIWKFPDALLEQQILTEKFSIHYHGQTKAGNSKVWEFKVFLLENELKGLISCSCIGISHLSQKHIFICYSTAYNTPFYASVNLLKLKPILGMFM